MREPSSPLLARLERPLAALAARRFLAALPHAPLAIALPDVRVGPEHGVLATLRLADHRALYQLCLDPELAFGDLYSDGRLEIEGALVPLLDAAFRGRLAVGLRDRLPRWLRDRALHQELGRAATNARRHYDVGNEFYGLWLDERMVYTCAYFPSQNATLEEAQLAKLDHVCRKVGLRPGMEVIELGSGWGALALHMARCYGVRVRAWNVSVEQVAYAREQAEKQQLADRVEFVLDDWRNATGRCDALRLGRDARARGPRSLRRARRPRGAPARARGARARAQHRARGAAAAEPLDRGARLPERAPSRALRDDAHRRAERLRGARRREPAPPLCAHGEPLARALRGERAAHRGARGSRHGARLAPLPGRNRGVVPERLAPPLPAGVHARGQRQRSRGRAQPGTQAAEMERFDVLVVGGGPAGSSAARGLSRRGRLPSACSTARSSRATRRAPAGSRRRCSTHSRVDPAEYAERAHAPADPGLPRRAASATPRAAPRSARR